jgi:membrane protease YdiL (CAAX protease family)
MPKLPAYFSWLNDFFPKNKEDLRPLWIFIIAAICLTGINFLTISSSYQLFTPILNAFNGNAGGRLGHWLWKHNDYELHQLIYWSSWSCFFYMVVPTCVIKLVWKEKLADYGFKLKGALNGWPIYLGMFLIIIPCVIIVSYEKGFQGTYPFYEPPRQNFMGKMLVWEIFYALQFITLEFFFRGFMVHGLKKKLGVYSIFAMVLPYCMIHFTKPLPECLGSIIAGVVLGTLSYRYKSVILGACIHITVAISMDFLSLWHKGYF